MIYNDSEQNQNLHSINPEKITSIMSQVININPYMYELMSAINFDKPYQLPHYIDKTSEKYTWNTNIFYQGKLGILIEGLDNAILRMSYPCMNILKKSI